MTFCQWATQQIIDDDNFFDNVFFKDEATFESTGILNRHNSHYWSPINLHWVQEVDRQYRWSVTMYGILNGYLIGPYFFNGNVNRHTYNYLETNFRFC